MDKVNVFLLSDSEKVLDTEGAKGLLLNKVNGIETVELSVDPDYLVPEHALPFDVVFYVVDGEGELTVEDKVNILSAGDSVRVTANALRIWKNSSKKSLKLLVMKHMG